MLIQLRQTEIEEALQQYIANQGISLVGKVVKIGFTSSRGEAGLTADVDITNATDGAKHQHTAASAAAKTEAQAAQQPVAQEEAEPAQEEQAAEAQAEEAPAKEAQPSSSLFS